MHVASRHGTPSLTSLTKDGGVSCFGTSLYRGRRSELFWSFSWKVAHPDSHRTQPCLISVKLIRKDMEKRYDNHLSQAAAGSPRQPVVIFRSGESTEVTHVIN